MAGRLRAQLAASGIQTRQEAGYRTSLATTTSNPTRLAHLSVEVQVFCDCQVVKQDIMLRAQAQAPPDLNHVL